MFHTRCFDLVSYTAEQMFNLVNDVSSYSKFIPGFNVIKVIYHNNRELIAEINLVNNNIIQSFITHNFFVQNKTIVIFLVKSPFKFYYGCWNFISVDDTTSSIEYISYYEFQSILVEKLCNYTFQKICKNIIKIFISRAHQIYGAI